MTRPIANEDHRNAGQQHPAYRSSDYMWYRTGGSICLRISARNDEERLSVSVRRTLANWDAALIRTLVTTGTPVSIH